MVRDISIEEFNLKVSVKFNNILEGYDKFKVIELYPNNKLNGGEVAYISLIREIFEKDKALIIDFYKNNLSEESINFIKENIDLKDNILLNEILNKDSGDRIYFEIQNEKYLDLLTKLNTRELFFVTFYFYKSNITIWGNYNMKFPLFYENNDKIDEYLNIAKSKNLL